jgi:hypothetical protein
MSRGGQDLYFMRNGLTGHIKIGSTGNVRRRLREIELAVGQPIDLLAVVPRGGHLEMPLHASLIELRRVGEWFDSTPKLMALIEDLVESRCPSDVVAAFLGQPDTTDRRRARGDAARRIVRQNKTAARVAELRSDWWRRFVTPTEASNA